MQLTMSGEYAVRAMIHLAGLPEGQTIPISEISEVWDIPESFLRKISARLAKAGLIVTHRGLRGGVKLAQPGESLTLLDVIEAVEGKISLNRCLVSSDFCHRTPYCAVHTVWGQAQDSLRSILASKTLRQLALESETNKVAL